MGFNGQADGDGFASTAWSLVLAAAQDPGSGPALDRLCRRYWKPVYAFARRSGLPRCDAEDATQDFFGYLLTREWLKQADPQRGSFRAFLLTLMRNYLANRRRRDHAKKRGGDAPVISIDAEECERELASLPGAEIDAATAYEKTWASCVLRAALERLAEEQSRAGETTRFELLRPYLTRPAEPGDYDRLSRALALPRNRIALLIHRHSRRYAELIRSEVAETLTDRSGLETELRQLLGVVAN